MKKKICALLLLAVAFFSFAMPLAAEDAPAQESDEAKKIYEDLFRESNAGELFEVLPESGQKALEQNGITSPDQESILSLSFGDILSGIINGAKEKLTSPLAVFCASIGVILLCAILQSFKTSFMEGTTGQMFSAVCVLALSGVLIFPISAVIKEVSAMIAGTSQFMLSFVPVYTGIVTASGMPVSAALSNGLLIAATEAVATIASGVLVPMLSIYMALCLIGASTDTISVAGIAKTVNRVVTITLGFLLTVFVGILTLQGSISASADTVTIKAAKFAVSAFVPVVGGAISDALSSVQGCVGLLRSVVGSFAVIGLVASFLPTLISLLLIRAAIAICGGVSSAFSLERITELLKGAGSVISLLISIVIIYALLLIVSLSVMMAMAKGAG